MNYDNCIYITIFNMLHISTKVEVGKTICPISFPHPFLSYQFHFFLLCSKFCFICGGCSCHGYYMKWIIPCLVRHAMSHPRHLSHHPGPCKDMKCVLLLGPCLYQVQTRIMKQVWIYVALCTMLLVLILVLVLFL